MGDAIRRLREARRAYSRSQAEPPLEELVDEPLIVVGARFEKNCHIRLLNCYEIVIVYVDMLDPATKYKDALTTCIQPGFHVRCLLVQESFTNSEVLSSVRLVANTPRMPADFLRFVFICTFLMGSFGSTERMHRWAQERVACPKRRFMDDRQDSRQSWTGSHFNSFVPSETYILYLGTLTVVISGQLCKIRSAIS